MTALLVLIAIISTVLTLWLIAIPVEVVIGSFSALRHGGHGWEDSRRHP